MKNSNYIIVAPRVIRPNEKIKISCRIFNKKWTNLTVKALIYNQMEEVASSSYQELSPFDNVAHTILGLRTPSHIKEDKYYLRVHAVLGSTGQLAFSNLTELLFETKSVAVLVQLERVDYRHDSTLRFRCIAFHKVSFNNVWMYNEVLDNFRLY